MEIEETGNAGDGINRLLLCSLWRFLIRIVDTEIQCQVRPELPLIFSVANVVLLLGIALSSCATVEWTRGTDVAEKLN